MLADPIPGALDAPALITAMDTTVQPPAIIATNASFAVRTALFPFTFYAIFFTTTVITVLPAVTITAPSAKFTMLTDRSSCFTERTTTLTTSVLALADRTTLFTVLFDT
jgi:hypothetical protein